ncbi:RNA polymerase sigma factor [Sabulilitoribacter multivorans]|uniref:RNA polymerase sigma factor n=1 Tax=Flaviramulus multivorans TaxID=1304750 RepID=A0ABS9IJ80_9FLAO|nr:RNA polymerase sigma factor [Flaviramulus multivorans]MCF7560650.1 RNA polymerase sigma factor [Flaviramulus multivorans]
MKTESKFQNLTDEELVEQITNTKNDILFEVLYERYVHIVYNKCYGFTKTSMEAEDLSQDVFAKLYIKLSSFKGKSKFSTWLYAFTYNMCVDYVKEKAKKKFEPIKRDIEDYDNLQIDVEDSSLFQLKEDTLKLALEAIAPEDKMILLLKYQDDFSIKNIMEVLNISESAVKMRLKRAKLRIIEAYNNLR